MNQSLMKRLRKKLTEEEFKNRTPLLGNVYFNVDGSIFEIDEVNDYAGTQINIGLFSINKSFEESWNRFRRSGLLDGKFTEEEKRNYNTLHHCKVLLDKTNGRYIIEWNNEEDKRYRNLVIDKMRLPRSRVE